MVWRLLVASLCLAAVSPAANPDAWAVPTFESLGLYYNHPPAAKGCRVHYRASGAKDWREGYPLVYDAREKQYRGALVQLTPDTAYDIRLETDTAPVEFQGVRPSVDMLYD